MKNKILRSILFFLGIIFIIINYLIYLKYGFSKVLIFLEAMLITCIAYLLTEYCNFGNKIKTIMKLKILRTILVYLGIILLSCLIYLEYGISSALAFFGAFIIGSIVYLTIEYDN